MNMYIVNMSMRTLFIPYVIPARTDLGILNIRFYI